MPLRPVTPSDAETVALHRYPEEVDAAERPIYAGWVAGAVERGVYQGFFIEKEGEVVAGAGLVRLEWGPSRGDPQAAPSGLTASVRAVSRPADDRGMRSTTARHRRGARP